MDEKLFDGQSSCASCGHWWEDHYSDTGCDVLLDEATTRSPYCPCDASPAARIRELEDAISEHKRRCVEDDHEPTEHEGMAVFTSTVDLWNVL